eukprot:3219748-Prymnesium_polylepis.1
MFELGDAAEFLEENDSDGSGDGDAPGINDAVAAGKQNKKEAKEAAGAERAAPRRVVAFPRRVLVRHRRVAPRRQTTRWSLVAGVDSGAEVTKVRLARSGVHSESACIWMLDVRKVDRWNLPGHWDGGSLELRAVRIALVAHGLALGLAVD